MLKRKDENQEINKEESLVYFFDDLKDNQKVNKIIIRPDFKLKKFGKTNAVITLGKVDKDRKGFKHLEKIR